MEKGKAGRADGESSVGLGRGRGMDGEAEKDYFPSLRPPRAGGESLPSFLCLFPPSSTYLSPSAPPNDPLTPATSPTPIPPLPQPLPRRDLPSGPRRDGAERLRAVRSGSRLPWRVGPPPAVCARHSLARGELGQPAIAGPVLPVPGGRLLPRRGQRHGLPAGIEPRSAGGAVGAGLRVLPSRALLPRRTSSGGALPPRDVRRRRGPQRPGGLRRVRRRLLLPRRRRPAGRLPPRHVRQPCLTST
jgi:hypothetical protein